MRAFLSACLLCALVAQVPTDRARAGGTEVDMTVVTVQTVTPYSRGIVWRKKGVEQICQRKEMTVLGRFDGVWDPDLLRRCVRSFGPEMQQRLRYVNEIASTELILLERIVSPCRKYFRSVDFRVQQSFHRNADCKW